MKHTSDSMDQISKIILIFFCGCYLFGCSTMQTKEEIIKGNIFKLNNPRLIIDISDDLEYAGKHTLNNSEKYKFESGQARYQNTDYIFTKDNQISKGVVIAIQKIIDSHSCFLPIKVDKKKIVIGEQSAIKIFGKTWQTYTKGYSFGKEQLETTDDLLLSPGQLYLAKVYTRIAGKKTMIIIMYIEDISEYKLDFSRYLRTKILSDESYKIIEDFLVRADNAIAFVE